MNAESRRGSGARVIRIDGEMTIYRAAELRQLLLDELETGLEVNIDLSGVAELDTSGVQLLIAAKKSARERNLVLRLSGHSPEVLEVLELYDLVGYFGDPVVMTSPA